MTVFKKVTVDCLVVVCILRHVWGKNKKNVLFFLIEDIPLCVTLQ